MRAVWGKLESLSGSFICMRQQSVDKGERDGEYIPCTRVVILFCT